MQVTFMGTGTSQGVPIIGCDCPVCRSPLPENKRLRPSLWLKLDNGCNVVIDTAPEFRLQALRYGLQHLDAVLFTHAHADHIFGFDDIRRFCQLQRDTIPVYGTKATLATVCGLFDYAFHFASENWAIPRAQAITIAGDFTLCSTLFQPLPVFHGKMPVTAYRVGNFAYVTDCSNIPGATMDKLRNLKVLVLDALRYRPHSTHFTVDEAVEVIKELRPKQAYLTHLCHEVDHAELAAALPAGIAPAYDGLIVEVN